MKNNLNIFINFYLKKKFNFNESIDLNIVFENKKKNFFSFNINLFHSVNEKLKILFLTKNNENENDFYYGKNYFLNFLDKKIKFDKIFFNKESFSLINSNKEIKNKFFKKKYIINNFKEKINELTNKNLKILINKNNFLNIKIGNVKFCNNMLLKNYFCIINNIKKIFFQNKINIIKVFLSTTMSKSFLIK